MQEAIRPRVGGVSNRGPSTTPSTALFWPLQLAESTHAQHLAQARVHLERLDASDAHRNMFSKIFANLEMAEMDFCLAVMNRMHGRKPSGLVFYPGAWNDVEHALMMNGKEYVFVDSQYTEGHVREMKRKIAEYTGSEVRDSGEGTENIYGRWLEFQIGTEQIAITLYGADVLKTSWREFGLAGGFDGIVVKKPCDMLYQLGSEQNVQAMVTGLRRGGHILKVGIWADAVKFHGKIDSDAIDTLEQRGFRRVAEGTMGAEIINDAMDNTRLYLGELLVKK